MDHGLFGLPDNALRCAVIYMVGCSGAWVFEHLGVCEVGHASAYVLHASVASRFGLGVVGHMRAWVSGCCGIWLAGCSDVLVFQ